MLSAGTILGPYEIVALIGEGGMGLVYRARDTKLNRDVALKILPDAFASDPDRLARFTREAQTLAALNHPNIAAIYGLEEGPAEAGPHASAGRVRALVMELVEGEDLSQKLEGLRATGSGLPLDEALPIAKQIAEALEAAHEQSIIHRDLKPANVKVRPDGTVKVLDFGLAKAMEPASGALPSMSRSPTITTPAMTLQGVILGTAAYMAPEQAKGRAVDRRADIWAFGVVLHEMITGRRLFDAEDMSETLAAVLTRDVSLTTLPAAIPPRLRALLRDCLIRDPRQRLRDIGDARIALEQSIAGAPDDVSAPASVTAAVVPAWPRTLPWTVTGTAVAGLLLVLSLWAPWRAEKPVDRPLVRLDVDLGADVLLPAPTSGGSTVAISPDGTRLVYASGSPTKLFTRRLDQPKATELPGTQGATAPFFSPNGQWVGFFSAGKVSKISVDGGAVVPLGDVATPDGASWDEEGSIFLGAFRKGLVRIPDGGGPPETLAEPATGELGLVHPEILPGGKAILFAADNPGPVDRTNIQVLTLADRHRKTLVRGGASPQYLAGANGAGQLVYVNNATLFAISFDLDTLETRGTAVPVVDDVAHEMQIGAGQFAVSRTGMLIYRRASSGASAMMMVRWVDPSGRKEPLRATPGLYRDPRVSPDGKRIALAVTEGAGQDMWVYDPQRDAMTRLTFGGINNRPAWSPDGRYVVFASVGHGLFQARADGASQPQVLMQSESLLYPWSFTPDGKRLAYYESPGGGQVWTVPLENQGDQLKAGKPEPFLKSNSTDQAPSFSPDGRWLAYQSNESGRDEVCVRAFPPPSSGLGGKWQISNNGGTAPRWSRSGHELVYQSGDQIMAASYTVNGDTFVAEKPRMWIAKLGGTQWDLAPDGKRVAVLTPVESADAPKPEHEVVFLLNFFDELRRRVPTARQ